MQDFEVCWDCGRQRAICRSKRRYDTPQEADAALAEIREKEQWAIPVRRYKCRWCPGFHLTRSGGVAAKRRIEKHRRKWAAKREVERRAGG